MIRFHFFLRKRLQLSVDQSERSSELLKEQKNVKLKPGQSQRIF